MCSFREDGGLWLVEEDNDLIYEHLLWKLWCHLIGLQSEVVYQVKGCKMVIGVSCKV